jgi:hypothetical protein
MTTRPLCAASSMWDAVRVVDAPCMSVRRELHGAVLLIEQESGYVELSAADVEAMWQLAQSAGMLIR